MKTLREGVRQLPALVRLTLRMLADGSHPWLVAYRRWIADMESRRP